MNIKNYTIFNEKSKQDFTNINDTDDAVEFLKKPENFRSFSDGLVELLIRKGYSESSDNKYKMIDYLYNKLKDIGSTTTYATVASWFSGTHQPKIESGYRKQIYEICFSMHLSLNETKWFFQHVYYDRAFNCHTIEESVFYYAIKNNIPYSEACYIIDMVTKASVPDSSTVSTSNYTQFIRQKLSDLHSTDELIHFLIQHKRNFEQWNQSASQELQQMLLKLIPTPEGKKEIDNIKRTINRKNTVLNVIPKLSEQTGWGLIMQEFFSSITDIEDLNYINGKNICSYTFVLERILYTSTGLSKKQSNLPYAVYNNFPSKKTMSDVLSQSKMEHSKSYDSIRKMLLLLYFYIFWIQIELGYVSNSIISTNNTDKMNPLYEIFIDETNAILYKCGYEELYAGNPYDWLFLCSAQNKQPLEYLRSCFLALLPDIDE